MEQIISDIEETSGGAARTHVMMARFELYMRMFGEEGSQKLATLINSQRKIIEHTEEGSQERGDAMEQLKMQFLQLHRVVE